ncbi:MAG: hypothetical protein GX895_01990 [Clostridiales bacterium]|nr:hypothetical protein [Clostridiales bacterium]
MENITNESRNIELKRETISKIYNDLNVAAQNLDNLFAYELNQSIGLEEMKKIANREVSEVEIRIISLINKDDTSNIFILSSDKKRIIYTAKRADEKRLHKHEAELILELSKEGHKVVRQYLIKGKYLNMYINYETKRALIENDIRALKFAIANTDLMNIRLIDDIYGHNEKIKLNQRKINIDLNKHRLHVDSITIVDSEVRISNGILDCCRDLGKWRMKNNEYIFIWIKKLQKYTSLELEEVVVSKEGLGYISGHLEEKVACLIGCSSKKDQVQIDKIAIRKCFFKLKGKAQTYILNSNAKDNLIIKNDFYDSDKVLKFRGEYQWIGVLILGNYFNNVSRKIRNIITVIPNKDRGYVNINGAKIQRVNNAEMLRLNAIELGEALLYFKKKCNENTFEDECIIDIYGDERGAFIKSLKYQEGRWREKIPPKLIPDSVNNDMQHYISIGFRPQKEWTDNIKKIIVLNSKGIVLGKGQYHIDEIRGLITIYNVFFDKNGRPYYKCLLEPGVNYIVIKAKDFEDNWICQTIRPIQIVEVKNGMGKAVTKIIDRGVYELKAAVISNDDKFVIERPVKIKIR